MDLQDEGEPVVADAIGNGRLNLGEDVMDNGLENQFGHVRVVFNGGKGLVLGKDAQDHLAIFTAEPGPVFFVAFLREGIMAPFRTWRI